MKKNSKIFLASMLALGCSLSGIVLFSTHSEKSLSASGAQDSNEQTEIAVEDKKTTQNDSPVQSESEQNHKARKLVAAPEIHDINKDAIFHMMLNSIDYYDKASGTIICPSDKDDIVNVEQFQTVLSDSSSYSKLTQCSAESEAELAKIDLEAPKYECILSCKDGKMIKEFPLENRVQELDGSSILTLADAQPIDDSLRISTAEDGMPVYYYRGDPTNVEMSSISLFPQALAFGYLTRQDLWDITGTLEYQGISCYEICGKATPEYGSKLNVKTFRFLVDVNTGVLVKYEGYDQNGNVSDFMYTEDLKFGEDAEAVSDISKNAKSSDSIS